MATDTKEMQVRLKERELNLLKAFIRVCEQLDLRWFVVQGTLLGTIRHGGFIPWDDDIDLGMPRSDYMIFLKKAQALLPKDCFLQSFHTDPEHYHCFAKLRDEQTTFIENTVMKLKHMHQGVFIDIFPFDYYPESALSAGCFELKKFLFRYRLRSCFYIPQDQEAGLTGLLKRGLMAAAGLLCPSERKALEESERLYMSVPRGRLLVNNGSPWGRREVVKASWMRRTKTMTFEGVPVRVPAGYDAYLRHVYGDYMKLPPVAERTAHHYARVIDPDTPYPVWMERISKEG